MGSTTEAIRGNLSNTYLENIDFSNALLNSLDFTGSSINGCSFSLTHLDFAKLDNVEFNDIDFSHTYGLGLYQLMKVRKFINCTFNPFHEKELTESGVEIIEDPPTPST